MKKKFISNKATKKIQTEISKLSANDRMLKH